MTKQSVAVIGAGKLGELVLSGLIRAGWPVQQLLATTRRPERAAELAERYGLRPVLNLTAVTQADVLLVAVKPQDAGKLLDDFGMKVPPQTLVVSLCAGLPTSFFAARLPGGIPIVRVMTNTPAKVDEAMTVLSAGPYATEDHLAAVEEIFRAEFDGAHAECGLFLLTLHPHIIGHRSRMPLLERLIEHICDQDGVWFATHEEVARVCRDQAGA